MQIKKQIKYVLALFLIVFPTTALAASVTLRWQANQEPDISGYNVYYGTQSRNYGLPIPAGNSTSYTIDNLTAGTTYYFAVTAVDTSGNESGYSSEVIANATSSEPATEDYQLLLSTNSDRSNAVKLDDQTISGDVYIFLDPEAYVSQVVFSIDGQAHNTENYAPYDLGLPFDSTSLAYGTHTISAFVRLQDGSTQTISAVCTVSNAEPPPVDEGSGAIPLPSSGEYGMIKNGDQSHVNEVEYSFDGMSGDVVLSYRVYDVDTEEEVRIYLNGTAIAYADLTGNDSWSDTRTLQLTDSLVNDGSQNIIVFSSTYNPPGKYWWGVGNASVAEGSLSGDTVIPLPSSDSYGMIKNGDQSHVNEVQYSFSGMSGDVVLSYRVYDVDTEVEVRIYLNGTAIAYADLTGNDSWSDTRTLQLTDSLVNDGSQNIIVFSSTYNPPGKYWWGVGNASVQLATDTSPSPPDVSPITFEPTSGAYGNIPGGDSSHVNQMSYSFPGVAGDVAVSYQAYDIDGDSEVRVLINGKQVATLYPTSNNAWGSTRTFTLTDADVNDSSQNTLVFDNTFNPPNTYRWGVRNVTPVVNN